MLKENKQKKNKKKNKNNNDAVCCADRSQSIEVALVEKQFYNGLSSK